MFFHAFAGNVNAMKQTCVVVFCVFFLFDSLHPSQQFSGLNQYYARINVSCSRTHTVMPVRFEPRVKHSTTESLCSLKNKHV